MQHYEEELGSQIRRQRLISQESCDRGHFCEKYADKLCGVTPDNLRDIEHGVLFGNFELEQLVSVIQVLWADEHARAEMTRIATLVIQRRREQNFLIEVGQQAESGIMAPGVPFVMGKPERLKPGRLDTRGGRI